MSKKNSDFIKIAQDRFGYSDSKERENRKAAKEDIEFAYNIGEGGQWPDAIRQKRGNRPTLTVNLLAKFVNRIVGEHRQVRPRIQVRPVDGSGDVEMAEVYNDIIRNIEYNSSATIAYDTAFNHAVDGGFGYFRILKEFTDDDSFDHQLVIKRIIDRFSVHMDPDSEEFDFSDMEFCFISEMISREKFSEEWPGKSPVDFVAPEIDNTTSGLSMWSDEKDMRIAEYYYKEPVKRTIVLAVTPDQEAITFRLDKDEITLEALKKQGYEIVNERKVDTFKVMWAKISGADILEGPEEQDGRYIPVIPVLGQEVYVDGKRRFRSLVRDAKDPQRAYNYYRSMATELISLAPKAPFILSKDQVRGHEAQWRTSNEKNPPYLLVNPTSLGIPKRQPQISIPTGAVQEAQIAKGDLEDTTGMFGASLGKAGNERSAKAINARESQSNTTTYTFFDNFLRAMIYTGRVLIDLIPRTYDTSRILRIRGPEGADNVLEINKAIFDFDSGEWVIINDITVGKYDVVVDTGADYATKRAQTADSLLQILQYSPPEFTPIILKLILKNMDAPGTDELKAEIDQFLQQTAAQPQPAGQQAG